MGHSHGGMVHSCDETVRAKVDSSALALALHDVQTPRMGLDGMVAACTDELLGV